MELRIYDAVQDPIIIFGTDRTVYYVNPSGYRFLGYDKSEELPGRSIDELVTLHGTSILATGMKLRAYEIRPYMMTHFRIPHKKFEGIAKMAVQCIPIAGGESIYALFIRERGFIEMLMDEEDRYNEAEDDMTKTSEDFKPLVPSDTAVLNTQSIDMTQTSTLASHEALAHFQTRVSVHILELNLPLSGESSFLTERWMDVNVWNVDIKPGSACTIEVVGVDNVRSFACKGKVLNVAPTGAGQLILRIQFEGMSTLTKRAIEEYIKKNMVGAKR